MDRGEEIKDRMGTFHNEVIDLLKKHKLTIPQVYLTLDIIKRELMEVAEKMYINKEEES